jgi:hypothetical protein
MHKDQISNTHLENAKNITHVNFMVTKVFFLIYVNLVVSKKNIPWKKELTKRKL